MTMSGQLHAPADLHSGKETSVPTECESDFWFCGKEKNLLPVKGIEHRITGLIINNNSMTDARICEVGVTIMARNAWS
jgi:hypothetical protein